MPEPIRVAVTGSRGKVGSVLAAAFHSEPGIEFVGGVELGDDLAAFLHEKRPRVLVDFTQPSEALHNALAGVAAGASPVIGTTGLSADAVDKLETACKTKGIGGIVAPNFAIGAALTNVFGRMVGNQRQGWAIFTAMAALFLAGVLVCYWAEAAGNPQFADRC